MLAEDTVLDLFLVGQMADLTFDFMLAMLVSGATVTMLGNCAGGFFEVALVSATGKFLSLVIVLKFMMLFSGCDTTVDPNLSMKPEQFF